MHMTMCRCVCYYILTHNIYSIIYIWNTDRNLACSRLPKKIHFLKIEILQTTFYNHNVIKPEINNQGRANNFKRLDIQINLEPNMETKL